MMHHGENASEISGAAGGYGPPPGGYPPAPPPGGYGGPPPGGFGPPPGGGDMGAGGGADVNTTLPLILAIVTMVCCGCLPMAIPALIFAIQAGSAKKIGDFATAAKQAKTSLIFAGIGIAFALIVWGIYFAFFGMAVLSAGHF